MARNRIICDSSALISLSMNCMLPIISDFSETVDFVIPKSVYDEIVSAPAKGRRFKLSSLRFDMMVKNGILQIVEGDPLLVKDIMNAANEIFWAKHKPLAIIQEGETEALAMAQKGDSILMDERTLRFLIERPQSLVGLLQRRMHRGVHEDRRRTDRFRDYTKGVSVLRSSELIARAYEKGLLEKYYGKGEEALKGCLWALKYSGCSITEEEINEYLRIAK